MDDLAWHISNEKGKSRTFEENKCFILALRGYLRKSIESNQSTINWDCIEIEAARDFVCEKRAHS